MWHCCAIYDIFLSYHVYLKCYHKIQLYNVTEKNPAVYKNHPKRKIILHESYYCIQQMIKCWLHPRYQ